jgi:hypothetical protein
MSDDVFGKPIYSYSRAQAIEDGVLVDVSVMAKEAGITSPVALTRAAYEACVEWTHEDTLKTGIPQDTAGRLWDVLWMLRVAVNSGVNHVNHPSTHGREDHLLYRLTVVERPGSPVPQVPGVRYANRNEVVLQAKMHGGDNVTATNADPVITILLWGED